MIQIGSVARSGPRDAGGSFFSGGGRLHACLDVGDQGGGRHVEAGGDLLMLRAGVDWLSSWVPILAYLGAGIFLNRIVLRGLIEWHPVYCTVQNVARSKFQ